MSDWQTPPAPAAGSSRDCCPEHRASGGGAAALVRHIRRLQVFTLLWMLAECGIALAAAWRARSPLLLAFGADSLVELLSAAVVLLQFVPRFRLQEHRAAKLAGVLLFILAAVVALIAALTLHSNLRPETSWMGIGIAIAALIVMPVLGAAKRRAGRKTGNLALSADAAQSATCAYLAAFTLAGLILNSIFRAPWLDPVAALAALPLISWEGWKALHGAACCRAPRPGPPPPAVGQ